MASELLKTVGGYELWGDPNIVELDVYRESDTSLYLNVTLKNHYFINPIRFTVIRPTRSDFNFNSNSDSHLNFVDGGVKNITNNGIDYPIGVIGLNVGVDSSFNKIEIVVDPENIESIDSLPPNEYTVYLDRIDNKPLYDLLEESKIDIYFNDIKYVDGGQEFDYETGIYVGTSNIILKDNEPNKIVVVNNDLNNVFDIDVMEENDVFSISKYNPDIGGNETIHFNVSLKSPDRIEYSDDWNSNIGGLEWGSTTLYPLCLKSLNIEYVARPTEPIINYPFLKLYKISDGELRKLSKELIDYNANPDNEDLTGYVNNLIRVPYPIKSSDETVGIQVYDKGFTATGNLVDDYIQEIKLGKIKCSHKMLSGIGYKNIEFTLYVPFFKPIDLEVNKVIDRELDLRLKLDLTNGQGTLNILIDETTYLVENQKIAKDIPFRADNINISLDDTIYNNKFKYPYVTVTVLSPDNTIDSKELKQRKIDKTNLYYVKSDNIYLSSKATYLEQIEIEYLIRRGVYINEY